MNNPYAIESHYRSLLGTPAEVVSVSQPEGTLRILRFTNQPCEGAVTVATSGCGLFVASEAHVYPECLIAVWGDSMDEDLSKLLVVAALDICNAWPDIEIGDCIGPAGPLHASTSMEALAIAEPAYFPGDLALACADDDDHIRVFWLIPLHSNEVAFIRDVGWGDFEELLSELDPDMLDLQRPPVVIKLPKEA